MLDNIIKESGIADAVIQAPKTREQLHAEATDFLLRNQECYVAQWILQNPFAKMEDYQLKFTYNETSMMGYTVTMEKIENV